MMTLDEYIANYDKYEDKVADITKKVALKQPLTDEEKEQYEKARNALTKLAAEVDRKNAEIRQKSARIEELLKENEDLQKKSKGFSYRCLNKQIH